MKTYYKKMNVLSCGIESKHAVKYLLKKKYAGTISLHLLYLSIFKITVLNAAFACLIFITSNLRQTTNMRKNGTTAESTKMTYEAIVATLLI